MRYARDFDVDGVLCGHIHTATVREIRASITYYNTGDWVESCTAIVERYDGQIELIKVLRSAGRAARKRTRPESPPHLRSYLITTSACFARCFASLRKAGSAASLMWCSMPSISE